MTWELYGAVLSENCQSEFTLPFQKTYFMY